MNKDLNYNEVFGFMEEFGIDNINRFGELIIDVPTNTYVTIESCKDIDDVKTYVVFALCRPIGKGLRDRDANRLLDRLNSYFNSLLTKDDMLLMYQHLCYRSKIEQFKSFIQQGFPIAELGGNENAD